jgi:UDP-N-acetylglucosamine diphosphorylase/glucosamine-1-phosphate N-acetyltransferase
MGFAPLLHEGAGIRILCMECKRKKGETVEEKLAVVILAAGKGTRMQSDLAKVLHPISGIPMIVRVVETVKNLNPESCVVVVGHQASEVQAVLAGFDLSFALQEVQLGTGHALHSGLGKIPAHCSQVLVLCGDTPLVRKETLWRLYQRQKDTGAALTVLAVHLADPKGYGRILSDSSGRVVGIVEEKDASAEERRIGLVNTGFYCFDRKFLDEKICEIRPDNAQGEYYLTDLVAAAVMDGRGVECICAEFPEEVMGINAPENLEEANRIVADKGYPLQFP